MAGDDIIKYISRSVNISSVSFWFLVLRFTLMFSSSPETWDNVKFIVHLNKQGNVQEIC